LDERQAEYVDGIEAGGRVTGPVRLAMEVTDSTGVAARLVAAGGEAMAAPVETPWGDHNARLRTPDGMQLTLFSSASS
ncbi:MAG: VOC family protein, partial [Acidimicrobiia bacterium]